MAATTNTEEELLILDNDTDLSLSDELVIEDEIVSNDEPMISFDDEIETSTDNTPVSNNFEEAMLDKIQSEKEPNVEETLFDLGSDFSLDSTEVSEEPKEIITETEKTEDASFDLGNEISLDSKEEAKESSEVNLNDSVDFGIELEKTESKDEGSPFDLGNDFSGNTGFGGDDGDDDSSRDPQSEKEKFDLNKITNDFIAKLNKGKETNLNYIKQDEEKISDLEVKIKKLRAEVSECKVSIKSFNADNEKIDSKIKLLK